MTDLTYAPPPFNNCAGQRVIFVDFTHARYRIEFDVATSEAIALSEIDFIANAEGHAAISINQPVTCVNLDGHQVRNNF